MTAAPVGPWGITMSRALPLALLIGMALSVLPAATRTDGVGSTALALAEEDVLEGLNRFRRDRGVAPLRMVPAVRAVAERRSASMRRLDYFGHVAPGGVDAEDLLRSDGVHHRQWGEIIGRTHSLALGRGGRRIVHWWKGSPTHRHILLGRRFSEAGVGIARDGGRTIWTVVLID